jgi:hypothetical protein
MKRSAEGREEDQPGSKKSGVELEVWVRRTSQTDEEALLVRVEKSGLVAHLYRAVSETVVCLASLADL